MVTKEQFINGVLQYIDAEVIPQLSTAGKWELGTMILLAKNKGDNLINKLSSIELFRVLELVNKDGLIDIDTLSKALSISAEKYGNLQVNLPFIGTMSFSKEDVDRIKHYINGGIR